METIIKSRAEYLQKLEKLDNEKVCGFCVLNSDLKIKDYIYWTWVYSEFPYWKYNTIVVSKRHKVRFEELNSEELIELRSIFIEAEKAYIKGGIMKNSSSWGLDIMWRQRVDTSEYETRSHIHIHLCPQREGLFTDILDPDAHIIDTSLLRTAITS